MKKINIIGNKYNKLIVVSEHSTSRNGHIRWNCNCECGKTCSILGTHLKQGKIGSCGCDRKKGNAHNLWQGYGEISGNFWHNHIVRSANGSKGKRAALELSITKEYAWNLFLSQNRKCALSGIILTFPFMTKDKSYTASLDRIDSRLGYVEGNVQWVHKDINLMKNKFNNNYFISVCKLISENNTDKVCEIKSI